MGQSAVRGEVASHKLRGSDTGELTAARASRCRVPLKQRIPIEGFGGQGPCRCSVKSRVITKFAALAVYLPEAEKGTLKAIMESHETTCGYSERLKLKV